MIHNIDGLTVDLTNEQYEEYLLNTFLKKCVSFFGPEISTAQLAHWKKVNVATINRYKKREIGPLKTGSKNCYFNLIEAHKWFERNKENLNKKW